MQENMLIGIHQRPKSIFKFLILSLQHVFAMFGSNVLVPILVNESAGYEVIPIQVAFFCSGIGTIIYLCMTGFKVPIYLGSSFAYLGAMTTL
jgi:uracil permease